MDGLEKSINLKTAIGIVIANMIGSGIFITSGIIAGMLPNSLWVILCWCFGGMLAIMGALCYSELATRMPYAGGEYYYLNKIYHPIIGFLSGWISFIVGFSAPIAGSAIGFSEYLFAGLNLEDSFSPTTLILAKKSVSAVIVLLFTTIHFYGIKKGSVIQNFLVFIKVMVILAIIVLGFTIGNHDWNNLNSNILDFSGKNGIAFGTAMMLVMFSYSGWNASSYIASEIKNPEKNIVKSLIIGTVVVFILYIGINLFFLSAIPFNNISDSVAIGEASSTRIFGNMAGNIVSLIISVMLLSSISAFIMIGPRIYYAMSQDGLFFEFAGKINEKYKVPGHSILIQGALAMLFVLFTSLEQLLVYLYYALNIFPILAVIGLFIARRKKIGNENGFKVPAYPYLPILFIIISLYLAVIAFINRPIESSTAIFTIILGIPIYWLWKSIKKTNKVQLNDNKVNLQEEKK